MGCLLFTSHPSRQIICKPSSADLRSVAFGNTVPTTNLTRSKQTKIVPPDPFLQKTSNLLCKDDPNSRYKLEFAPCHSCSDRPNMPTAHASSSKLVEASHRVKVALDRLSIRRIAPVDCRDRNTGELGFTGRTCSKLRSFPI